jgi:hypothetical protein
VFTDPLAVIHVAGEFLKMSFLFGSQGPASASSSSASSDTVLKAQKLALTHQAGFSHVTKGRKRRVKKGIIKLYNSLAARPSAKAPPILQTIQCILTGENALFTSSASVPTYGGLVFTTNSVANPAAYLSLFDQYRVDLIEVWVRSTAPQGTSTFADMASCIDLDDGNTPTNFVEVENHPQSVVASSGAGRYFCWQPHVAVALFSGAFTSYGSEPGGWIDSASPSVQHFGLKFAMGTEPVPLTYLYTTRMHISFRSPGF